MRQFKGDVFVSGIFLMLVISREDSSFLTNLPAYDRIEIVPSVIQRTWIMNGSKTDYIYFCNNHIPFN